VLVVVAPARADQPGYISQCRTILELSAIRKWETSRFPPIFGGRPLALVTPASGLGRARPRPARGVSPSGVIAGDVRNGEADAGPAGAFTSLAAWAGVTRQLVT